MELVNRVKAILLNPNDTWQEIKNEPATVKDLFTSYAALLAAIPPIASFIGFSLIGLSVLGFPYRRPLGSGLGHLIVSYVFSLVGVYLVGMIIDALAPSFGSSKNQLQAMKVAVYSWTPGWVAGAFLIIPSLSPLSLLASLYGLYLFYLGLPILMETPQDKAMGYVIVTILVSIVVSILVGSLSGALFGYGHGGMMGWRY
jgi:hypothetical protein